MKILVSCVPFDKGKSGISVCIREQVKALSEAGHELTLILEPDAAEQFPGYDKILLPGWTRRAVFSMLYHLFILPFRIRKGHFDFCVICAANRRAFAFYPCFTIAIVHDLSQYHVKAKYDAFRMFYIRHVLPFFVRRAPVVAAISKSTQNDLEKFWHIPHEKLRLVPDGLTLSVPAASPGTPWRERIGLRRPYLLYISRLEHPGKNHVRLIQAFDCLPAELADRFDLVMPGAKWEGSEPVFAAAEQSPHADHFYFPGFIDDADLDEAFSASSGYIFPSLFEGFGLSLIEAMHRGVPCACSATSSLGEIGEGCAILFDPENIDEIADAMRTLLTDREGNAVRIQKGYLRAAEFSWKNNAEILVQIFRGHKAKRPSVFGVSIDNCTMTNALTQIDSAVQHARETGLCAELFFVNAHCLNLAYSDCAYRGILNHADAVWPDGSGVRTAGRLLGFDVPENVNGTDLFPLLCNGRRSLYLLGARPGVAEAAAENVRRLYPAARIAGTHHGYFANADEERRTIDEINAANPDLLLVAFGVPAQEKWIDAHRKELHCGAALAVGGLLDFVSGRIPRAPLWMRRAGIEWIYRLYQEPVRLFRRYVLGNPLFLFRVLKEKITK